MKNSTPLLFAFAMAAGLAGSPAWAATTAGAQGVGGLAFEVQPVVLGDTKDNVLWPVEGTMTSEVVKNGGALFSMDDILKGLPDVYPDFVRDFARPHDGFIPRETGALEVPPETPRGDALAEESSSRPTGFTGPNIFDLIDEGKMVEERNFRPYDRAAEFVPPTPSGVQEVRLADLYPDSRERILADRARGEVIALYSPRGGVYTPDSSRLDPDGNVIAPTEQLARSTTAANIARNTPDLTSDEVFAILRLKIITDDATLRQLFNLYRALQTAEESGEVLHFNREIVSTVKELGVQASTVVAEEDHTTFHDHDPAAP